MDCRRADAALGHPFPGMARDATALVAQPEVTRPAEAGGPSRACYSVASCDELRAATHRAPHFGQTYIIKLPTVCSTTPSVPHFGHLFVGWVGAGTWMGMAVHSTRPCARASRGAGAAPPNAEDGHEVGRVAEVLAARVSVPARMSLPPKRLSFAVLNIRLASSPRPDFVRQSYDVGRRR